MPKPLLTDEVIEQAKQDKKNLERKIGRASCRERVSSPV